MSLLMATLHEFPYFLLDDHDLHVELSSFSTTDLYLKNDKFKSFVENASSFDLFNDLEFNYYNENKFNNFVNKFKQKINLGIYHVNIRGLNANSGGLVLYLSSLSYKFDVIALSEIRSNNISLYINLFPDFTFLYVLSPTSEVGGVGVYIRNDLYPLLTNIKITSSTLNRVEDMWIEISINNIKYLIGVIYRHPNQSINLFRISLIDVICNISKNRQCIILGDINIDFQKFESQSCINDYVNDLLMWNFLPISIFPTRITAKSATIIDHIYTNCHNSTNAIMKAGNLISDFSDHLGNFILILQDFAQKIMNRPLTRLFLPKNILKFRIKLQEINWSSSVMVHSDPDLAYTNFDNQIQQSFEECFPLVIKSRKASKNKLWMTKGLRKSSVVKNRLYLKYIKTKCLCDEIKYKKYKTVFSKLIKVAEKSYYSELLDGKKKDIKHLWSNLNSLCNPKTQQNRSCPNIKVDDTDNIINDPQRISNHFNAFYADIGGNLASMLPPTSSCFEQYLSNPLVNSMVCDATCKEELLDIVKSLKNKKSCGSDNITTFILKQCMQELVDPLVHIFNKSLSNGIFPSKLKIAKVIPLFKNGDSRIISNYRPISLLSVFSKILEKLMFVRLMSFFNRYNILYDYQFGFRKNYSSALALIEVTNMIYKCLDKEEYVIGLYLDLRKAFDTVNHDVLLSKLFHYGVRGHLYDWFVSYLSGRVQFTVINSHKSNILPISCGVPQGSILGPLLFLIYINDISSISDDAKIRLFADDSNLFVSNSDIHILFSHANDILEQLYCWLNANKLSINYEKTYYMIFNPTKHLIDYELNSLKLYIGNYIVPKSNCIKYLGVQLDDTLCWKPHILYLEKKIKRFIGIFYKRRDILTSSCRKNVYYAFVYSNILYGIEVYANTFSTYLSRIMVINNSILRILQFKKRDTAIVDLYQSYNTLPIPLLYKLCILKIIHNVLHKPSIVPVVISSLFKINSDIHSHNTRYKNDLHIFCANSSSGRKQISLQGALFWSTLPLHVRMLSSLKLFIVSCKEFLIGTN